MSDAVTRAELLRRGAAGGAALLAGGTALAALAEPARAEPLSDGDLAYARLLVGIELLAGDFYTRALASNQARPTLRKFLRRADANERAHYDSVAKVLSGAGLAAATPSDFDFTYPSATFRTQAGILRFALDLETMSVGAYLGAAQELQSATIRGGIARIAASEAMHLGYLLRLKGRDPFLAFPNPLTIEQASNALEGFIV